MSRLLVSLLLAAVAVAPSATAQRAASSPKTPAPAKPAAPRREIAVPFAVGETLTYDVSWSSYLTAGTAVTTVKERKPSFNSTAYYIVAEGRPTPLLAKLYTLYYKLDTLLDSSTLLPQRGSVYSEEGKRHRLKVTRFDRAANKVFFEQQTATTIKADFAVPPATQDALSALYVMRALPLKAGDRMTMPVSDDGVVYKIQLDVGAPERVKTPAGEFSAWHLKPTVFDAKNQQVGRNVAIWISNDARRIPVKLQAELPLGSFNLVLSDVR